MTATKIGAKVARRNDVAVKIDAEVARKAKIVAAYKDQSLAEFISEVLRPIVEQQLIDHARASAGPDPKPGGKK